jgi:hypothetical protein
MIAAQNDLDSVGTSHPGELISAWSITSHRADGDWICAPEILRHNVYSLVYDKNLGIQFRRNESCQRGWGVRRFGSRFVPAPPVIHSHRVGADDQNSHRHPFRGTNSRGARHVMIMPLLRRMIFAKVYRLNPVVEKRTSTSLGASPARAAIVNGAMRPDRP